MGKKVHSAVNPLKKEKKVKRERPNDNPVGSSHFPIPTGHSKPFVKSPQHAKWPSMMKRHLGVIEAHIRVLDRVMQSMQAAMNEMDEEERGMWERGEKGMWATIGGMMRRAKGCLIDARLAGVGILPSRALKEKKGLGTYGSATTNLDSIGGNFTALGQKEENADSGSDSDSDTDSDSDSDSDSSSSDDSSSTDSGAEEVKVAPKLESKVKSEASFTPLKIGKKRKLSIAMEPGPGEKDESGDTFMGEHGESNPYFVVDTEPTAVVESTGHPSGKKRKELRAEANKLRKEASAAKKEAKEAKKALKRSNEDGSEPDNSAKKIKLVEEVVVEDVVNEEIPAIADEETPAEPEIDFQAVQEQFQAEVDAGLKAAETKAEKKERKRKRLSDGTGTEVVVKKHKKDKSEKKRKAEDGADDGKETKKKPKNKGDEA